MVLIIIQKGYIYANVLECEEHYIASWGELKRTRVCPLLVLASQGIVSRKIMLRLGSERKCHPCVCYY